MQLRTTSAAITEGIRIEVVSRYLAEQSMPSAQRYVFAYTVKIVNESKRTVQLKTRHWVVRHGDGKVEEVRGPGVVGEQPILAPGESFQYTSGSMIRTPRGSMNGSYRMVADDGHEFDAMIASFALEMPYSLN